MVHGLGIHPDWALIGALRSDLPEHGYTTLAIQMPVLAADAKGEDYGALFGDAGERLATAAAWLRTQGHSRIAIVSHSMLCETMAMRLWPWVLSQAAAVASRSPASPNSAP